LLTVISARPLLLQIPEEGPDIADHEIRRIDRREMRTSVEFGPMHNVIGLLPVAANRDIGQLENNESGNKFDCSRVR